MTHLDRAKAQLTTAQISLTEAAMKVAAAAMQVEVCEEWERVLGGPVEIEECDANASHTTRTQTRRPGQILPEWR